MGTVAVKSKVSKLSVHAASIAGPLPRLASVKPAFKSYIHTKKKINMYLILVYFKFFMFIGIENMEMKVQPPMLNNASSFVTFIHIGNFDISNSSELTLSCFLVIWAA